MVSGDIASDMMLCDVLIPIAAILGTIATTTGTVISASQTKKAKRAQDAATETALRTAAEATRKDELGVAQSARLRQRRSAGSGQGTILSGGEGQADIGRNVLLGQ